MSAVIFETDVVREVMKKMMVNRHVLYCIIKVPRKHPISQKGGR